MEKFHAHRPLILHLLQRRLRGLIQLVNHQLSSVFMASLLNHPVIQTSVIRPLMSQVHMINLYSQAQNATAAATTNLKPVSHILHLRSNTKIMGL